MINKRLLRMIFSAISILLLPLIAMQFTDEVNWTIGDFVMAAILLTILLIEFVLEMVQSESYRTVIILAILILLLLFWAELAVGIFETPFAGS